MFEISVSKLLLIGVIIALLFGTKKLRSFGSDLGETIKGFKKAMQEDENPASANQKEQHTAQSDSTIHHSAKKSDVIDK